jgi:Raf kinase inhibitor-like YbhB/YbcL family protein
MRTHAIALVLAATVVWPLSACAPSSGPSVDSPTKGATMLRLTTDAFTPEESLGTAPPIAADIPVRFAMTRVPGGRNVSIPYSWSGAPTQTRSFALSVVDAAPVAREWVHWLVVDIPASATALAEGASGTSAMPSGVLELGNGYGFRGWGGPQPPAGTGRHPYVATLYALDVAGLQLAPATTLAQFRRAIEGHVLASATATGRFGR